MLKNKKGFTLIELLAVIVVLAIIGVIAVKNISDTLEKSTISAFKTTNDMIIKEIKTKISKNKLGLNETIACLNYGENSCTDIYDLSKDDYALSINDLGNDNYDVILVGKGSFEDVDVDGYGNNIIYTNINEGQITSRRLEKTYVDYAKMVVKLEDELPNLIKKSYEENETTQLANIDVDVLEKNEFYNDVNEKIGEFKNESINFSISGSSGRSGKTNTHTFAEYVQIQFSNSEIKYYNGEPLFDNNLFTYTYIVGSFLNVSIKVSKEGILQKVNIKNPLTNDSILKQREKKYGYKTTIINAATDWFEDKYNIDELTDEEIEELNISLEKLKDVYKGDEGFNYAIESLMCSNEDYENKIKFRAVMAGSKRKISAYSSGINCLEYN